LGGDWELEVVTGNIEAESVLAPEIRNNYQGITTQLPLVILEKAAAAGAVSSAAAGAVTDKGLTFMAGTIRQMLKADLVAVEQV
jgi:hypothetical protein